MRREERYEFRYAVPTAEGCEDVKAVRANSRERVAELKALCRKYGYRVVSCKKLYPFSTNKNQHNFELVANVCFNTMYDMENDVIPYDKEEHERLGLLRAKAQRYFCYELPVAWVTWEELCEMRELANMAVLHRQDACIKAGRPELVALCAD